MTATSTNAEAPPHALSCDEVLRRFQTSTESGLTVQQIAARRHEHGRNVLSEAPPPPLWRRLARQFKSPLVGLLLVAGLISGALGQWPEAVAILAIVLLNGIIGFLQEERAERALASLRRLSAPTCRVNRDGREHTIPASELVPGDVIHLESGDRVPADARLVESFGLSAQEGLLTGESVPVEKESAVIIPPATLLGDRRNMLYAGTSVTTGKASAIVIATGMNTELGRIAGMLERVEREPTPLERRLAVLGRYLVTACLILVAVIFLLNVARGHDPLEVFLSSVSLAVAAVPEGLPAVVTVALALGVRRMVRRHALIRNLPAVETLGCVMVICSDKTGTLTRNEMTVREVWTPTGRFQVTGVGYAPEGSIRRIPTESKSPGESDGEPVDRAGQPDLWQAITIGVYCNNARLDRGADGAYRVWGDPTEAALRVLAAKAGMTAQPMERLHELPFESERKAMSVIVRDPGGRASIYTKGAAERVLDSCAHVQREGRIAPISPDDAAEIREAAAEMGRRALRVLALAWRPTGDEDPRRVEEGGLIFVGLVGMIDPPRDEARPAVRRCRDAGIRPVMITGDHPETARAVARELELLDGDFGVMTGAELDEISDEELPSHVERIPVFARVSAEHKLRVVRALRSRGQVAAMTGDGVNDAPAVKAADIGVAMGRTGTDVTRGASDMVLLDDNFASIVAAVEEGRGIFDNIQKVTRYLLSCNIGELMLLFFAALVGWPAPLHAVQILWINLITDGVPALALGVEPPERDIMKRPPRHLKKPLISGADALSILWGGFLIAVVAGIGFAWMLGPGGTSLPQARAVVFAITAFSQLFFAIGCRSRRYTMPEIGWFANPALFWAISISVGLQMGVISIPMARNFLKTGMLDLSHWAVALLLSLIPVTIVEITKLIRLAAKQRERGVE